MRVFLRIVVPAVIAVVLAACVSAPEEAGTPNVSAARETALSRAKEPLPADGLEGPRFGSLPEEAKTYLKKLSAAFRGRDREFLLAQGEAQYEEELRPRFDESSYLAMLYRAGSYNREAPAGGEGLPRLECDELRGIEYTEWKEQGPLLEIKGRLYMENGPPLPCEIMLAWRLLEPKIIGLFP